MHRPAWAWPPHSKRGKIMYRIITYAAAGALFITSQAIAQEKVSFPSTDGDLKGGTPTTITSVPASRIHQSRRSWFFRLAR
jgi:hypothetical protein